MSHLLFLFGSSFVIGLSGAMMPGPVLTATISEVLKRGFWAGPLIVLGHGLLEVGLLVGIINGLGAWMARDRVVGTLGLVGGFILLLMGAQIVFTARAAAARAISSKGNENAATRGPILSGILTSLANPYWSLWWATIGLGYAAYALESGWPGIISFYTGHILSDLAWFSLVAFAVAAGRNVCPERVYRGILVCCGIALGGLGLYFLYSGFGRLRG